MNRGLNLVAGSTEADPNHAVARLLSAVENSNHIARAQFAIEAENQCSAQADFTSVGFLQEAVTPCVHAPNCKPKVNISAWFAPSIFVWAVTGSSVNAAEISHASP